MFLEGTSHALLSFVWSIWPKLSAIVAHERAKYGVLTHTSKISKKQKQQTNPEKERSCR